MVKLWLNQKNWQTLTKLKSYFTFCNKWLETLAKLFLNGKSWAILFYLLTFIKQKSGYILVKLKKWLS